MTYLICVVAGLCIAGAAGVGCCGLYLAVLWWLGREESMTDQVRIALERERVDEMQMKEQELGRLIRARLARYDYDREAMACKSASRI